jgi:hypothetical protein
METLLDRSSVLAYSCLDWVHLLADPQHPSGQALPVHVRQTVTDIAEPPSHPATFGRVKPWSRGGSSSSPAAAAAFTLSLFFLTRSAAFAQWLRQCSSTASMTSSSPDDLRTAHAHDAAQRGVGRLAACREAHPNCRSHCHVREHQEAPAIENDELTPVARAPDRLQKVAKTSQTRGGGELQSPMEPTS